MHHKGDATVAIPGLLPTCMKNNLFRTTRYLIGKSRPSLIVTAMAGCCLLASFSFEIKNGEKEYSIQDLRKLYSSGDTALWPKPTLDASVLSGFADIGPLGPVPHPADNLPNEAKVKLGKILFFDPRLSVSGQIACASCHEPQLGWGDGKRVANGHDRQLGKRNAMTIFNTAYYKELFWDGRASSLEDQARFPVQDHLEMNQDVGQMAARIGKIKGYEPLFEAAFAEKGITLDKILKAIACFERTVVSPKSRFDLFVSGKSNLLSDQEVLGLHLFRTKARCINCHNTPLFSDNKLHNDGQTLFGSSNEDLGRYNITHDTNDVGKFRTPSLREVAHTGPWMHNGNFPTLKDVVFFYDRGNPSPIQKKYKGDRDSLLPKTDPLLQKLNLNDQEVDALLAFMEAITTPISRVRQPDSMPQ
jgi:cytochrome c peroxidase